MNITFTGNPYSGTGVVGITGTFLASAKAAKMNEDKDHKVTLEAQKALAEASKIFRIENKNKSLILVDDRNYMYIPETFRGKS